MNVALLKEVQVDPPRTAYIVLVCRVGLADVERKFASAREAREYIYRHWLPTSFVSVDRGHLFRMDTAQSPGG